MDSKPTIEICKAVSASDGDYNGAYITTGSSEMMIQANGQNAAHRNMNADSMCIVDDAHFDLPLYMQSTAETSWYSSYSEDMERFYKFDHCNSYHPLSINAADNIMSVCRQSAFGLYLRPAHSLCVNIGRQDLMKRSFTFLRKIDENRREAQRLSQAANIQEAHQYNGSLQNKASFQHMLAERNRRVKLKQHFSLLHSLLPNNSKKDKYSVLANTSKYMTELKSRVDELDQRNRVLEESLKRNISSKEGCSSLDLRGDEHLTTTIVYSSDEVILGQSKSIPNQLDIQINVQIDPLSSPTSLLILLLQQLKELQLEVVSVEYNIQTFTFQAHLLLIKQIKGDEWESSKWESLAEVVRRTFI